MYEAFYGLKEKPFSLTPNPRFLYLSRSHNEVYAHLLYGIENRSGFIMVTGEVGTGKTTILRTLLNHLDEKVYRLAFIFNPKLTASELLHNINREFGIDDPAETLPDLIERLNLFLLEENRAGRVPVLVIDEAQNLSGDVLEQIRLLSNLETETDKLIQIVLVGQPELQQQLNDPSLRQLNQRIAIRYRLVPLNKQETASYVRHRLKIAGRPDGSVFTSPALNRVYQASGGVPRMINLLCDRAMLAAYSAEQGTVTPQFVRHAVLELAGEHEKLGRRKFPWGWVGALCGLILLLGLYLSWDQIAPSIATVADTVAPARPVISPTEQKPVEPVAAAEKPSLAVPDKIRACNALLSAWDSPTIEAGSAAAGLKVDDILALQGMQVMKLRGTFDQLLIFNLPFIFLQSGDGSMQYYAVTGRTGSGWQVVPPYHGRETLAANDFAQLDELAVYMPWKDFAEIGYVANPGSKGQNVRNLQLLLGTAGDFDVPITGRYDRVSIQAVQRFQDAHGLTTDGMVGPRTLAMLYRASDSYEIPELID